MADQMIFALVFLIEAVLFLLVLAFVLRFILQAVRADFYNPLSQAVVKVTDPVVRPTRRIIPAVGGLDLATLLLSFVSTALLLYVSILFKGQLVQPVVILVEASFSLLHLFLRVFLWSLIAVVVISWLTLLNVAAPGNLSPLVRLLDDITRPMLAPIRRLIPPVGGLDFSVLVALAVIFVLQNLLIGFRNEILG